MDTPTTADIIKRLEVLDAWGGLGGSTRQTATDAALRLRQLDAEVHERPGKEVLEALRRELRAYYFNPTISGLFPSCPPGLWDWVLHGDVESDGAVSDDPLRGWTVDQWGSWVSGLSETDLARVTSRIDTYPKEVRKMLRAAPAARRVEADRKTAWEYMHWLETHRPEDLRNWALLHDRAEVFPEPHTAGSDLWPDGSVSEREHSETPTIYWTAKQGGFTIPAGSVSEHTHPKTPMAFTGSEPRLHFKGLGGLWRDLSDKVVSTTVTLQSADDGALWNLTTQFADECAKPLVEEPEAAEPVIEYPQVLVVNGMIVVELHENRSDYIEAVTVMAIHQNPHPDGAMVTVETESSEDAPHLRQFVVPSRLADKFVEDLKLAIVWGAA